LAYDYTGSLSQKYILFVTTIVVTSIPGANFSKVMIFMDEAEAAANFVVDPGVDSLTELTYQNWSGLLKATGGLWGWINGFYANNQTTHIFVVTFNDGGAGKWSSADLTTQFGIYDQYAYWKLMYDNMNPASAQVALATLCGCGIGQTADPLSQYVYGTSDPTTLTGTAASPGTQVGWFRNNNPQLDVLIAYHPSTITNAALMQIAATLEVPNATGTNVGNKTDWLAIPANVLTPSGAGGTNLSAIQAANLQSQGVAFYTFVGDNSGNVALEAWFTIITKSSPGANWIKNYIDTVASQLTTTFLTATVISGFLNNDTYQGILNILQTQINLFVSIGRLGPVPQALAASLGLPANIAGYVTAPPFNQLPAASGGAIVIPKAWSAIYNGNVRSVIVYGTLVVVSGGG